MSLGADSVVEVRNGVAISREQFRSEQVAAIRAGYSPALHLGFPSLVGAAVIAACLASLRGVTAQDAWFVPLVYMAANAIEWRAHKHLLHRRTRSFEVLYDRHTPVHHRVYMTDDMALRSARELGLILMPAYAIVIIFLGLVPVAVALYAFVAHNLAFLFVATSMFYVVSYEWLHLAYHLPATTFVGGLWVIRRLRRHHALHHDPRLMQKWNFNVTLPLWDWVRGTAYPDVAARVD